MNRIVYTRLMAYIYGEKDAYKSSNQKQYMDSLATTESLTIEELVAKSMYGEYNKKEFKEDLEFAEDINYVSKVIDIFIKGLEMYSSTRYKRFVKGLASETNSGAMGQEVYDWTLTRIVIEENERGVVDGKKVVARVSGHCNLYITIPINPTLIAKGVVLVLSGGSFKEAMLRNIAIQENVIPESFAEATVSKGIAKLFIMSEKLDVRLHKIVGPILDPDTLANSNHMFFSYKDDNTYFMAHPIEVETRTVGELIPVSIVGNLYSNSILQKLIYEDGIAYIKKGTKFMQYINKL